MQPSCPYWNEPDASFLRLVLIGELLRADDRLLGVFANVMLQRGLLALSEAEEKPEAVAVKQPKGMVYTLRE